MTIKKTTRQGQPHNDTQCIVALPGSIPPAANVSADTPNTAPPQVLNSQGGHPPGDTQYRHATLGPFLRDDYPLIGLMADTVDDMERVRIASENRYRAMTTSTNDKDGEMRGLGLNESVPEVARQRTVVDGVVALEHTAIKNLERQVNKHPLWIEYAKYQKGIGPKQFARLLATIGDPYWNDLHNRPRTLSELRAYCGMDPRNHTSGSGQRTYDAQSTSAAAGSIVHPDGQPPLDTQLLPAIRVAAKRKRGVKSNWNEKAKMRLYLVSVSCIIHGNADYREVYDKARIKYADAVHQVDCPQCGPSGHPAKAGSPLSLSHQNGRGLRAIGQEILNDLWWISRDIHNERELEEA